MAKRVVVKEHRRKVNVTKKNPDGYTIVDRHERNIVGRYLIPEDLESIFKLYDKKKIKYPTANKLNEYKNADQYDELIAVWCDYFSHILGLVPSLDPNVIKALIASESGFKENPPTSIALGVTQITKQTFKVLQDPKGEAKDFIFLKFKLNDLRKSEIAIPMAIRWLIYKKKLANKKLGRESSYEEAILEYKGLLKSSSGYKKSALNNFRKHYELLNK